MPTTDAGETSGTHMHQPGRHHTQCVDVINFNIPLEINERDFIHAKMSNMCKCLQFSSVSLKTMKKAFFHA